MSVIPKGSDSISGGIVQSATSYNFSFGVGKFEPDGGSVVHWVRRKIFPKAYVDGGRWPVMTVTAQP